MPDKMYRFRNGTQAVPYKKLLNIRNHYDMMTLVINMEMPQRKPNRITNYDYSQSGAYFVTLCTHNRAPLFEMEPSVGNGLRAVPKKMNTQNRTVQNQILHKWIRETVNKFSNIAIDKYVIMSDHLHLIVNIKEQHAGCSLPDIIHFFKAMTTNEYIWGVKNGLLPPFDRKLWQKSYYDHVIRNQQDYNETWEYVENNPTKWMLLHNMLP